MRSISLDEAKVHWWLYPESSCSSVTRTAVISAVGTTRHIISYLAMSKQKQKIPIIVSHEI